MTDANSPYDRLAARGLALPTPSAPKANYIPVQRSGSQIFVSGQVSEGPDGLIKGRLGDTISVEDGKRAAERCALSILAQIHHTAGVPLDKIQMVKLSVMVNSTADFFDHPQVANGASDLFVDVLGDRGKHARSAFGVAALPLGVAVEIEAIVDVKD